MNLPSKLVVIFLGKQLMIVNKENPDKLKIQGSLNSSLFHPHLTIDRDKKNRVIFLSIKNEE